MRPAASITEQQVQRLAPGHVHPQWNEREPNVEFLGILRELEVLPARRSADRRVVLDAYLAAGGNFVDTADSYMNYFPEQGNEPGQSETIIGN